MRKPEPETRTVTNSRRNGTNSERRKTRSYADGIKVENYHAQGGACGPASVHKEAMREAEAKAENENENEEMQIKSQILFLRPSQKKISQIFGLGERMLADCMNL